MPMRRQFLVAAACVGIAVGAIDIAPTPATAASVTFSFGFGSPGPYPYPYPRPFYPQPFYGGPMYHPQPQRVCYPVVQWRKVFHKHRIHRVHWRRVVVTVCRWQGW